MLELKTLKEHPSNPNLFWNMIKNKFKINDIIKATGLSKEEIIKLKEEN